MMAVVVFFSPSLEKQWSTSSSSVDDHHHHTFIKRSAILAFKVSDPADYQAFIRGYYE
jgi:hypothetical protein